MDKWNSNNAPRPKEVEIRIRDTLELIADQCVNPIIHLLWKDHVHIECYKKRINRDEKVEEVTCDFMKNRIKSSKSIRKIYLCRYYFMAMELWLV